MFKKILLTTTFLLTALLILPLISPIHAAGLGTTNNLPGGNPNNNSNNSSSNGPGDQILDEFCQRRQGDTINLETWYAGKCHKDGDQSTFSGDSLGFGDIIFLHLYELIRGENAAKGDSEIFKDLSDKIKDLIVENRSYNYLALLSKIDQDPLPTSNSNLNVLGNSIAYLISTPPVSSNQYFAYLQGNLSKHRLVTPAYAQNTQAQGGGYGFNRLQGFLPLWKAFRNIAYFFFVLAFVFYGFAIMFRVKINPQTAANIQSALPKLAVTLILITFSYAIVGLVIDFMWVFYYLFLNTLDAFDVFGGANPSGNLFAGLLLGKIGLLPSGVGLALAGIFGGIPGAIGAILGVSALLGAVVATFSGIWIISSIILTIALFISLGKIFIKLVGSYVYLIIYLVLAPIILLTDVIPGRNAFNGWLNGIIANVVVFPVTAFLLLFSGFFMIQPIANTIQDFDIGDLGVISQDQTVVNLPLLSPQAELLRSLPGGEHFAAGSSEWYALIGLALLIMAPKFIDMTKAAFGVKLESDLFKEGAAVAVGAYGVKKAYQEAPAQPGEGQRPWYRPTGEQIKATGTAMGQQISGFQPPQEKK